MSQENVELLRPVYEEWERGNLRAGKELLHPEVESVWPQEFPSGATYRGPQGHGDAMREWLSPWKDFRLIAEGFYEAATASSCPSESTGAEERAESRLSAVGRTYGRSAPAGLFVSRSTSTPRRPSKPWACQSKTLAPAPEPAGY
jgi:hypothetical protein